MTSKPLSDRTAPVKWKDVGKGILIGLLLIAIFYAMVWSVSQ